MALVAVFLILVFLFSLVAKWAAKSVLTGPMVFAAAGILAFFLLPGRSTLELTDPIYLLIGEVTLAVILFGDATHISLREVTRESELPARLLGIGMPLSIVAGTLTALLLVTDLPLWEAAILATILAPTDASLGSAVVKSELVPHRIREALHVESGLNDGLAVPLLVLFVALAGAGLGGNQSWLAFTAQQIGFGVLVGLGTGWLGGLLMMQTEERGWIGEAAQQLALLCLAVLSWLLAEKGVHGNGFVAAFVAGAVLRWRYEAADRHMARFSDAWGLLLVFYVFFAFGFVAAPSLQRISGRLWLYALLSLTVVRTVPVAISMFRTGLQPASVLFLGWFGPRGLASVVLGLIYLEQRANLAVNPKVVLAMIATVLLSILAHGVSANPATKVYARKMAGLGPEAPELALAESGVDRER
jgi:NhaP-type Na+/H+ or K+/H+ antiporter